MSRNPVQAVLDPPVAADDGGELGVGGLDGTQRGDGVAGLGGPLPFYLAAAHDLDGLAGVGEGQAFGHRGDLEGAPLGPAVTALSGLVSDRDVPPGQGGKLGIQAGLISLDRDQIVRAAPGEVAGVLTLGVQSVRGDDRVLDVQAVAQRGEHRDFVCLGAHLHLAQHHAMGLVERREQVTATVTIVRGAT
jgi:hypothetical protein